MLSEIREQPETLGATLARYVEGSAFRQETVAPVRSWLARQRQLLIAASGSSRHAGLVAEVLIEAASDLPVDVEFASEYGYRKAQPTPGVRSQATAGVIVISQSGETADTLTALRRAAQAGQATLAITNVAASTMAREADVSMPTEAGRERAIPATKSFTAQLLVLELLALMAAEAQGTVSPAALRERLGALEALPALVECQLAGWEETVRAIADQYSGMQSFLFLGRGVHYPIAREGALKLKESAYVHAEGYPSGELKHGPNALVSETTPLVMLATYDPLDEDSVLRREKVVQLMRDMRAQGANILAIANEGDEEVRELATSAIPIMAATEPLLAICEVIPMQMLAYFVAVNRGIDVDRPRNLVKAVVAE
jgi:glucosamine--fructose-6-phosphate aminotransferase (isomerizing)